MALNRPTGSTVIIVEWLLILTALVLVAARLYLRLRINRQSLTISDIFVLLTWCTSVAYSSCDSINLSQDVLEPDVDTSLSGFSPETVEAAMKTYFAGTLIIVTSFHLSKAAILAFYFQLVPAVLTNHRKVLWALVAFTIIGYFVSIVIYVIWTVPVHCNWSFDNNCHVLVSSMDVFRIGWAIHFAGDIFIFIFPLSIYRNVQMERLVKLGVYFIFALGVVNIAFCLSRFLMIQLDHVKGTQSSSLTMMALWVDIDLNVGLIIACLPSLRPYLRMVQSGSNRAEPQSNKHAIRKRKQPVEDSFPTIKGGFEATTRSITPAERVSARGFDLEAQEELYDNCMSRTRTLEGANSGRSLGSDVELVGVSRPPN